MSTVHIDPGHLRRIAEVLEQFPVVSKASVFGSRSLGTETKGSDVDLALYGSIDEKLLGRVRTAMDDTVLPYFFDIVTYDSIHHPPLLQHIDQHGIVIFERKNR